jgi:hypothetical protein
VFDETNDFQVEQVDLDELDDEEAPYVALMKMQIKRMSHLKRRTMIKGEMTIIKTRKIIKKFRVKNCLTQESTKRFKEITP